MASSKKSMSAHRLRRMVGTNYETAWFLFHRLREAAAGVDTPGLAGKNEMAKIGESYIGVRLAIRYSGTFRQSSPS
jgi:hypothetical protein